MSSYWLQFAYYITCIFKIYLDVYVPTVSRVQVKYEYINRTTKFKLFNIKYHSSIIASRNIRKDDFQYHQIIEVPSGIDEIIWIEKIIQITRENY